MQVGDRVRVAQSVIIYHHPEHRGEPLDIQGMEGEIVKLANEWQGKPIISANLPYQVLFTPKFRAHLREDELEVVRGNL